MIAWINQLSDTDLILFLDGLRISRAQNDWWEELPVDQKKQILEGLKDPEEGKVIDSEKVFDRLRHA